jgi:hypothetical protein
MADGPAAILHDTSGNEKGVTANPVTIVVVPAATPACTNVSAAVADTALLAASSTRLWSAIFNDSVATLYLKLGTGASTTSFTIALGRYDYYEPPAHYTGAINGYWSAASGSARVTSLSIA